MAQKWLELGHGFCIPTNFEKQNDDVLQKINDEDDLDDFIPIGKDGEINIKSNHANFNNILDLIHESGPTYYDERLESVNKEDFESKLKTGVEFTITFCELEPPQLQLETT